ncbi:MAG: hypothetical protein QHH00_01825 [Methanomassiliicoccales archaeon]|jgi:(p)ppGpp synthase/HD superfamily hydrolase|nr:hypothetical protein [Methanomassiliicoccales archaeon]
MEVIRIIGENTQGVLPKVLSELVRRKVEVNRAFVERSDGKVEMVFEIRNSSLNGKLLHSLRNLQDVISVEYLKEKCICRLELSPEENCQTAFVASLRKDN